MSSYKSAPQETTAKAPQRRRGHERVASLLDAAADVFARGYEAATMTEIAARAGASIGSLYQFFPTKPVLADALYLRDMEALTETLAEAGEEALAAAPSLDQVADRLFMALVAFVGQHPALPIVSERRDFDAARRAAMRPGMIDQLAEIMGRADPRPTPEQARHAAGLVLLLMKGAIAARVHEDPEAAPLIDDVRAMLRDRFSN